jgi:CheY-like chemotaxis protein
MAYRPDGNLSAAHERDGFSPKLCVLYPDERLTLPKGAMMDGTILVCGNEVLLVETRHLILEQSGYQVFSATDFADAANVLVNQRIDLVLLCQSLSDTAKRRILEKARAIRPDLKCAVFSDDGRELKLDGTGVFERVDGPSGLLKATEKLLIQRDKSQTVASI